MIDRIGGYNEPKVFADFLQRSLEKFANLDKVTPADSPYASVEMAEETGAGLPPAGETETFVAVKATSKDPAQAEREEKLVNGVAGD